MVNSYGFDSLFGFCMIIRFLDGITVCFFCLVPSRINECNRRLNRLKKRNVDFGSHIMVFVFVYSLMYLSFGFLCRWKYSLFSFCFPENVYESVILFSIILVSDHSGDLTAKGRGINRFVNITRESFS